MNKHSKDLVSTFLIKNNFDTSNVDFNLLTSIFKFGIELAKSNRPQIWYNVENIPKIRTNRQICMLVQYGGVITLETIQSSDFKEFILTHSCLKWCDLEKLMKL